MTDSNTSQASAECERCEAAVPRTVAHHTFGGRVCLACLKHLNAYLCVGCEDESDEPINADKLCAGCASKPRKPTVSELLDLIPDDSVEGDW